MTNNDFFVKQLKPDDLQRWFAFGLIALAVLVFYFPSLYYPPRADQVIYLSETAKIQHPWDLIVGCYDHNRHRTIAPGDELLFRPLLYAFLGTEQVLFGHHFWAWQLVGLLSHLILLWVLLRLLWHLSGPWLAFGGTWLFASSVSNYELVTWPHLSSYLLMMACVVAAIEQMIICIEEAQVPWARIMRMLACFLIACFIYETANIFALMITGMLLIFFPKSRWRVSLLVVPVVLYAFCSYFNYTFVDHISRHTVGNPQAFAIGKYVLAIIQLTLWWLYEGLFNGLYHYVLAIRTMFLGNEVMVFKPLELNSPQVAGGLVILMAFFGLAWSDRRQFLKRTGFFIVLLGMLISYVAVIVIGRYQEMGDLSATVRVNSYFLYIFWVLMVIIAFVFINAQGPITGFRKWLVVIFVTASLLSGLWQGKKIYDMAVDYSNRTNNIVLLVTTLDFLVQEKGAEPDFSFYVDPYYPGNYPYGAIRKITDPPSKEYSFAEFLYPQYFRPRATAAYKFLVRK